MKFVTRPILTASVTCLLAVPGIATAQEEFIHASEILNSNISNGLTIFGRVTNVLLDENSESVEYLFFERSETLSPTATGKGFVEVDNMDFTMNVSGEVEVVVEDTDSQREPEELEVSRSEAEYRLVSNILDESLQFADDQTLSIEDILINPDSGNIEYFMVEMPTDSFFDQELRAIPAGDVEVSMAGTVSTKLAWSDVESGDRYKLSSH